MTQLITRTRTILLTRTKIGHILFKVLEVEENSSPEFASNGARRARYPDGCASTFKFAGVLSSKCPTIDRTLSSRIWTTTVVREVLGGEMKRLRNPRIGPALAMGKLGLGIGYSKRFKPLTLTSTISMTLTSRMGLAATCCALT